MIDVSIGMTVYSSNIVLKKNVKGLGFFSPFSSVRINA